MTTKQIPIWIDCDTGTDDTVAIMLAHALPELQIIGLSAVAGNSLLCNTFPNTRRVVHLLGADYPVYPGAERPLVREPHVAGAFHGENGLGNVQLPLPDTAPEQTPAWDALYEAAARMPGELTLVATGPLTNAAIALTAHPALRSLLRGIALMGGAAVGGNRTPCSEFNIHADPDAAEIVFSSGIPIVMCGLDVTEQALLYPKQSVELDMTFQNIMSVNVPVYHFKTKSDDAGEIYPYGFATTSGELDDAVDALSGIFQDMLRLAQIEKTSQLLAEEIEKTRRRVNALEYVKIPQMEEAIQYITMKLDENERANTIRLMKVKDMLLKEAIEEKREADERAIEAFGGRTGAPEET